MKPLTLLIMAAGVGSRYGGMKQLDRFGPKGETLLEYSVRDAQIAGFTKVVLVIRPDTETLFKEQLLPRFHPELQIELVHQALDVLPEGCTLSQERIKPWGTGHAVWVARDVINEPFAVINADDFYGAQAFRQLAEFLTSTRDGGISSMALVGYLLRNTLSSHGTVSRGVCLLGQAEELESIQECSKLREVAQGKIEGLDERGNSVSFIGDERVSMNCWGFYPSFFQALEDGLKAFMEKTSQDPKAEFYLPSVVDGMLRRGQAQVQVLFTQDIWFGVTYPQDKERVIEQLAQL